MHLLKMSLPFATILGSAVVQAVPFHVVDGAASSIGPVTRLGDYGNSTVTGPQGPQSLLRRSDDFNCNYKCRLRGVYENSYLSAATGIALVMEAYNSTDWCVHGPGKSWCDASINGTLSHISSMMVKDDSVMKKDCNAEELANHMLDTGYNATALGLAWALRAVNGTDQHSDTEKAAMPKLKQTAGPLLASRWKVNGTALTDALAHPTNNLTRRDDKGSSANDGSSVAGDPKDDDDDNKNLGLKIGIPAGVTVPAIIAAAPLSYVFKGHAQAAGAVNAAGKTSVTPQNLMKIIRDWNKIEAKTKPRPWPKDIDWENEEEVAQAMEQARTKAEAEAAEQEMWSDRVAQLNRDELRQWSDGWWRKARTKELKLVEANQEGLGGLNGDIPAEGLVPGKPYRVEQYDPKTGNIIQETVETSDMTNLPSYLNDLGVTVTKIHPGKRAPADIVVKSPPYVIDERAMNLADGLVDPIWTPVGSEAGLSVPEGETMPELLTSTSGALAVDSLAQPIARVGDELATLEADSTSALTLEADSTDGFLAPLAPAAAGVAHDTFSLVNSAGESIFSGVLDMLSPDGSEPPHKDSVKAKRRPDSDTDEYHDAPEEPAKQTVASSVAPKEPTQATDSALAPPQTADPTFHTSVGPEEDASKVAGTSMRTPGWQPSMTPKMPQSKSDSASSSMSATVGSASDDQLASMPSTSSVPQASIRSKETSISNSAISSSGLLSSLEASTFARWTSAPMTSPTTSQSAIVASSVRSGSASIQPSTATSARSSGASTTQDEAQSTSAPSTFSASNDSLAMSTTAESTTLEGLGFSTLQSASTPFPSRLTTTSRASRTTTASAEMISLHKEPSTSFLTYTRYFGNSHNESAVLVAPVLPTPSAKIQSDFDSPLRQLPRPEVLPQDIPASCNATLPSEGFSWIQSANATACPVAIPYECSMRWANNWLNFYEDVGFPRYCADPDPLVIHREAKALRCVRDELQEDNQGRDVHDVPFASEVCKTTFRKHEYVATTPGCDIYDLPDGIVWSPPEAYGGCPVPTPAECTGEWLIQNAQNHSNFPLYCADRDTIVGHEQARNDGCLPDFQSDHCIATYFREPTGTSLSSTATSLLAKPKPTESCLTHYKALFDTFNIYGAGWDEAKLGASGQKLHHHLKRCGAVSKWRYENLTATDDVPWTFHASGHLGIGRQHCIEKAMRRSGAPIGKCKGTA